MMSRFRIIVLAVTALVFALVSTLSFAATSASVRTKKEGKVSATGHKRTVRHHRKSAAKTTAKRTTRRSARLRHVRAHRYVEHFHTSSYATDVTDGDDTAGED